MKFLKLGCSGGIGLIFLLCVCLSLITIPSCSEQFSSSFESGDDEYDPPDATCDNAGVSYDDNPFSGWPQQGRSWDDVNYYYCAQNYYDEFGRDHWGIDIDADDGEPVYATADATVVRASEDTVYGMGKNVKICTDNAWCAVYMHLDDWAVSSGDDVNEGDVLGYADNTGFSTGTHLHYQIEDPAGQPVDPAPTFEP